MDFKVDQKKLTYDQIPALAAKMPDGLPAGEYYLKMADTAASALFTIEETAWRNEVMTSPIASPSSPVIARTRCTCRSPSSICSIRTTPTINHCLICPTRSMFWKMCQKRRSLLT